jgi:hypothetical protein
MKLKPVESKKDIKLGDAGARWPDQDKSEEELERLSASRICPTKPVSRRRFAAPLLLDQSAMTIATAYSATCCGAYTRSRLRLRCACRHCRAGC